MVPISVGGCRLRTERSGRAYRNRNEDLSAPGWTGALSGGSGKDMMLIRQLKQLSIKRDYNEMAQNLRDLKFARLSSKKWREYRSS